jgi:hypothetical protein
MTYEVIKTSIALRESDSRMKEWGEEDMRAPYGEDVKDFDYISGIPVDPSLFKLASEIRKINPAIKFCSARLYKWINNRKLFDRLYAYREGHEYVLGEIGYGDYRLRKNYDNINMYMVSSRKIENQRVKYFHDQHHMALTDNLKNAVKNACKYLVPHTLEEVASMSFRDFTQEVRYQKNEAINTARSFVDKCTSFNVVRTELHNLIRLGVQFVTPEFKSAAEELFKATAEAEVVKARKIGAYFIQFKEYVGVMRVNVLTFDKNFTEELLFVGEASNSTQFPASDLPLDIQEKIAVLSMVDDNTSIPGVGRKISATSFWLERELT